MLEPQHIVNKITAKVSKQLKGQSVFSTINPNTLLQHYNESIPSNYFQGAVSGSFVSLTSDGDIVSTLPGSNLSIGILATNIPQYLDSRKEFVTVYLSGVFRTSVYETHGFVDNITPLDYTVSDLLYISPYGLLTKEQHADVNEGSPVGYLLAKEEPDTLTYVLFGVPVGLTETSIDVIDLLTSFQTTKALSANQGRVLNNKITDIQLISTTIVLNSGIINDGYFILPEIPVSKGDVVFSIRGGTAQLNFWSSGFDKTILGPADFAVGRKNGTGMDMVYLRSDGNDGGYDGTELFDGSLVPNGLPEEDSVLIVSFLKK